MFCDTFVQDSDVTVAGSMATATATATAPITFCQCCTGEGTDISHQALQGVGRAFMNTSALITAASADVRSGKLHVLGVQRLEERQRLLGSEQNRTLGNVSQILDGVMQLSIFVVARNVHLNGRESKKSEK